MLRVMAIDGLPSEPFVSRDSQLVLAPGSRVDVFVDVTLAPGTSSPIRLHDGKAPRDIGRLVCSPDGAMRATPLSPAPALAAAGLPPKLDFRGAVRVELPLAVEPGSGPGDWMRPGALGKTAAPAMKLRKGQVAIVALVNRAPEPVTFHLHGQPFRWLDRLDDGWKPFWLDTLLINGGATERLAFLADQPGPWLIEAMATRWDAPRLARWDMVD